MEALRHYGLLAALRLLGLAPALRRRVLRWRLARVPRVAARLALQFGHLRLEAQLLAAFADRLENRENIDWHPLELQQLSNEIELFVDGEDEH